MSTDWDLYCVECNERAGLEWNNGADDLVALWEHRQFVAGLNVDLDSSGLEVELKHWRGPVPVGFFAKHRGHAVRPRSEYGEYLGDCSKPVTCDACEARHKCKLPAGHAEPCGIPMKAPLPAPTIEAGQALARMAARFREEEQRNARAKRERGFTTAEERFKVEEDTWKLAAEMLETEAKRAK